MTFKQLYANIKKYLDRCINGETLVFTHRGFYGYEFHIKAIKHNKDSSNGVS